MPSNRTLRTYDHRLIQLVQKAGDAELATRLGVPKSTASGWIRRSPRAVVTASGLDESAVALRVRVARLERRVLAQTEISFSNSLIEAWWRVLKHGWLFLNNLDSEARARGLVEFYVAEHNGRIPHAAFQGQTPDEMYFGFGAHVPDTLTVTRADARQARLAENRARRCAVCT